MLKWIKSRLAGAEGSRQPIEIAVTADRALALIRDDALQEAEILLRGALRAQPSDRLARMLGALYASQQRYDEAIDALYQAFQLEPRHAATANLIGVCHSLMMSYEEAAIYYGIALESDPSMADAYANAGWNARLLGRPEAAGFFREWLSRTQPVRRPPRGGLADGRLKLDTVTLCCLDSAYHALAADALRFTLSKCDFAEALFFGDRDCEVSGVRFVPTERITSSAQYSNFLIHNLHEYIGTDHVLIIQYDGFVLNPAAWDAEFLLYDYIGAKISINKKSIVGNGGFSLRSRKLLRALRDDGEIRRYDAFREPYSEDLAICDTYRDILESRHGIRFAPEAVADRFSAELTPPTLHNFGFHNLIHLIGLYENQFEPPEQRADGAVEMVFRASTELGPFAERRQIELRGNDNFQPQAVQAQ
jgi:tetratricopeptide (TPR) repeat protein